MRYTKLGRAENPNGALAVSRLGPGCMGMSAFDTGSGQNEAEAIRTLNRAIDLGVTLFDTAEMYGPYTNEVLLSKVLARRRDEVKIATKFGIHFDPEQPERRGFDARPETGSSYLRVEPRRALIAGSCPAHERGLPCLETSRISCAVTVQLCSCAAPCRAVQIIQV